VTDEKDLDTTTVSYGAETDEEVILIDKENQTIMVIIII
jgi:hypothetical protein